MEESGVSGTIYTQRCAGVAALDIPPEAQARILTAAEKLAKCMNRYIANHSLTLVANVASKRKP